MKALKTISPIFAITIVVMVLLVFCGKISAYAQPKPPKPIKVTINMAQGIQFGAFVNTGSTGTVEITPTGVRNRSGGIVLVNLGYSSSAAIYSVTTTPGTLIMVNYSPTTLTGPVPSTPLTLNMGPTDKGNSFVATQSSFTLSIGGILTVPANPTPGSYSGLYTITFIQQ